MEWKEMRNYENHTASSLSQYAAEKIDASVSILAKNNSFFVHYSCFNDTHIFKPLLVVFQIL